MEYWIRPELTARARRMGGTWLTDASVLATGDGERQAGGEEISLLVPSSPDSSVTGDSKV